ncbi:ABC transporter permease [Wukongibacter baidiensis]|uniref:ABC transporter permease n=1 Tax=Wukongibacter baidiensis TaxID=1723361 RepID=UPI003D7F3292
MSFRILSATFKRNFIIQVRAYPIEFFIGNLLGGLYTILSAYFMYNLLFKGSIDTSFVGFTGTSDYMSYVILGASMYLFIVRTLLNVSRSLITEARTGTLESLMLAPFDRFGYFIGNMLQQTITTSIEFFISILIGIPFGLNISNVNISSTLLAAFISLVAFFGMSILLASIMLYFRDTYISQNTLFLCIFLICGITFPIEYLPTWVQSISKYIPVTTSLRLIRNSSILGLGIESQLDDFIRLSILAIIYLIFGFIFIKKVEKISLEKTYI